MKGQALITLKATEALTQTGGMPINIKWLFEGEEEVGSPNLAAFIASHTELLACNFAVNPDSGMIGRGTRPSPTVYVDWHISNCASSGRRMTYIPVCLVA